jgi:hypothetical protein
LQSYEASKCGGGGKPTAPASVTKWVFPAILLAGFGDFEKLAPLKQFHKSIQNLCLQN